MTEHDELTTDYVRDRFVDSMFTSAEASALPYADFADVEEEQTRFDAWLESVRAEARRPRVIETAKELREAISTAFQNGVNLTVLSQNWRPWVIWEDDNGHAHASSVPVEDDPERLTLADVKLPVTVLWEGGE